MNGKLMFSFWCIMGDDFHVTRWNFAEFPFDLTTLPTDAEGLEALVPRLENAMHENTVFKLNAGKRVGSYNLGRCRPVTDDADRMFLDLLKAPRAWEHFELFYGQMVKTDFAATGQDYE
ncbi:MAG: hypothetical protein HYX52_08595 [Chloroflexi bacterium]|nr:hypothetical protein [Chloroflexota bacterium]